MNKNDYCVFILSHGRPDNIYTIDTLKKHGYTGNLYIVIDNEDKTAYQYYKNYGDKVIMFDKEKIAEKCDTADNFSDRKALIFARNVCFEIAQDLGFTYFIELDDDYTCFWHKYDEKGIPITGLYVKNLDNLFSSLLDYYKNINALSIAIAQTGDFLGGKDGNAAKNPQFRKCMNSFICSTERPFKFIGRLNEDVNTYTLLGRQGNLFLTIPMLALQQKQTQKIKGGVTNLYKKFGTYVKSFYSAIFSPSCVSVKMMQSNHPRLHHSISWNNAAPMIIRETHRKDNS